MLYNLPADTTRLPKDVGALPPGTQQGLNDWKRSGWSGPCPPMGRHRYVFTLYALDSELGNLGQPTRNELEKVMGQHVLGRAVLMGTFQKRAAA